MKRCLSCEYVFDSVETKCPNCGHEPKQIGGFIAYAPETAIGSEGFKPEYFEQLAKLEAKNFWFKARNELILWAVQKFCRTREKYLEVGCGTGFVLSGIVGQNSKIRATGSEVFVDGLRIASKRVPSASFIQMDARKIPFVEEFDIVGAFDVIEHIEEDELVLEQLFVALRPGGNLLLTVPQHMSLWSNADEYACHKRRYSSRELLQKVRDAGFCVETTTSFVTTLLPALIASRLVDRRKPIEEFDETKELTLPFALNEVFLAMLRFELALIKRGIRLPFGGTRLLVAKKQ